MKFLDKLFLARPDSEPSRRMQIDPTAISSFIAQWENGSLRLSDSTFQVFIKPSKSEINHNFQIKLVRRNDELIVDFFSNNTYTMGFNDPEKSIERDALEFLIPFIMRIMPKSPAIQMVDKIEIWKDFFKSTNNLVKSSKLPLEITNVEDKLTFTEHDGTIVKEIEFDTLFFNNEQGAIDRYFLAKINDLANGLLQKPKYISRIV